MAKQRFSISPDEDHTAQIKATAARLGEDVSAFMTKAAMEAVRREQRKTEIFRDIDEQIAAVESGQGGETPTGTASETDPQVTAEWDDFFGTTGRSAA
ncbi:hypothetical protein [Saccharothrix sp. ST-888]|uniref:hypothetical protein n=1 Tax=Saccharothrix sp. ST-888 TaxID=1427391 RepID=UPI0005ED200B|nr:hypothetical protein [Saccharothrix sp. ST-888]KJK55187.1 hypothetical protein UK12_30220 [Saccharothrix sp. ST-888]